MCLMLEVNFGHDPYNNKINKKLGSNDQKNWWHGCWSSWLWTRTKMLLECYCKDTSQPVFNCVKSTMEKTKPCVKSVQSVCCKIRYWSRSGDFIVNFEHISHNTLVLPLLTLKVH